MSKKIIEIVTIIAFIVGVIILAISLNFMNITMMWTGAGLIMIAFIVAVVMNYNDLKNNKENTDGL